MVGEVMTGYLLLHLRYHASVIQTVHVKDDYCYNAELAVIMKCLLVCLSVCLTLSLSSTPSHLQHQVDKITEVFEHLFMYLGFRYLVDITKTSEHSSPDHHS